MGAIGTVPLALCLVGMLTCGSYLTLSKKWQFQTCAPSLDPVAHGDRNFCKHDGCAPFNKPWAQNLIFYFGMTIHLPIYYLQKLVKGKRIGGKVRFHVFSLPAFCEAFGSTIGNIGLLFLDAAVWQMFNGATIICTALFTRFYLKTELLNYRWFAVIISTVGLAIVGYACILDAEHPNSTSGGAYYAVVGIICVLVSSVLKGFQMCFEELLLTGKKISAKKTVGCEGLWACIFIGVLLSVFNNVPGSDHNVIESTPDTLFMMNNNPTLYWLMMSCGPIMAIYAWFGLTVCKHLSAVTRCLVDTCRTCVVWIVQILIGYYGTKHESKYGEKLLPHSWLQLIGFVLLVIGTFGYNGVIKFPGFRYEIDIPMPLSRTVSRHTVRNSTVLIAGLPSQPLLDSLNDEDDDLDLFVTSSSDDPMTSIEPTGLSEPLFTKSFE